MRKALVILSEETYALARERARLKQQVAEQSGVPTRKRDFNHTDLEIHLLGALCEMAYAQCVGGRLVDVNPFSGDPGYDVFEQDNTQTEVKGTTYSTGELLVPNLEHLRCDRIALVIQLDRLQYEIAGTVTKEQFEFLKQKSPKRGNPWFIKQDVLISVWEN